MRRLKLTQVLSTPGVTRAPTEKEKSDPSVRLILRLRNDLPPGKGSLPILLNLLDQVNCLAAVERRAQERGRKKPRSPRGPRPGSA